MCHLKLGNVEKARDNCTKALAIDPTNEKALFRRGKCYSQLGALDEAKTDLEQVLSRSPDNRDALREMQTLKRHFASHKKKEQKRFAGFFDKLQAEEPSPATSTLADAASASAADPAAAPAATPPRLPDSKAVDADTEVDGDGDGDSDIGEPLGDAQAFEPNEVTMPR